MEKNVFVEFLNIFKSLADEAIAKCENEKEEEVVASDDVQVTGEDVVSEDSIATTKGNEEKETFEEVEAQEGEEAPVLEAADETAENPETLKNVEAPEEKSDEERLFETAEQLCAIAEQIYKRSESMTEKQAKCVAKVLAKQAQKIAKICVKKEK